MYMCTTCTCTYTVHTCTCTCRSGHVRSAGEVRGTTRDTRFVNDQMVPGLEERERERERERESE